MKKNIPIEENALKDALGNVLPNDITNLIIGYNGVLLGEIKTKRTGGREQIISLDGNILYSLEVEKYGFKIKSYSIISKNLNTDEKKEVKLKFEPKSPILICSISDSIFISYDDSDSLMLFDIKTGKLFCTITKIPMKPDLIKLISINGKNVIILLTEDDDYENNKIVILDMENSKIRYIDVLGQYLGISNDILYFNEDNNILSVK